MPGYIIHLCEGRYIADKLHISKESQPELLNDFLLGCVLPDAVMDKALTHFRPEWQNDLITKYPDIDHILSEYPVEAMAPADLGILAHLMMDAAYVEEFWPQYFQFEADDNTPTCVTTRHRPCPNAQAQHAAGGKVHPIPGFLLRTVFLR